MGTGGAIVNSIYTVTSCLQERYWLGPKSGVGSGWVRPNTIYTVRDVCQRYCTGTEIPGVAGVGGGYT